MSPAAKMIVTLFVLSVAVAGCHYKVRATESTNLSGGAGAQAPAVSHLSTRDADSTAPDVEFLKEYCFTCHNDRRKTAGLSLEGVRLDDVAMDAVSWEAVLKKLRTASMPPPNARRPDPSRRDAFANWLEGALDAAAVKDPVAGRTVLRRLNRTEYVNAVRDLLAVEVDGRELLPSDPADLGFDNMSNSLATSPMLLERFLSAAQKVSRAAVGHPRTSSSATTYNVPIGLFQDERMSNDLPFGSRGGIAVRHHFSVDGTYSLRLRLRRQLYGYIRGLSEPQQIEVRVDGRRVATFEIGGDSEGRSPASFVGAILGDSEWEEITQHGDDKFEVQFAAKAGPRLVGVSFVARPSEVEGVLQPPVSGFSYATTADLNSPRTGKWEAALDTIVITGPHTSLGIGETPSRRQIFQCRPATPSAEEPCAEAILSRLARLAFRRNVGHVDLKPLLEFYRRGRAADGFESGITRAIERILVDPEFLFHIERDPSSAVAGVTYRVGDFELASRLSFFLWSSLPDDRLLTLAAENRLHEPATLRAETQRMLADRKSRALVDNFAEQWLLLRNIKTVVPDPDQFFPDFDDNLRRDFESETKLFFESQLRSDASILELIRANYSFLNERLARYYGLQGIAGERFRRVEFPEGHRGGLLGHGSILTVTSYANRTSPVLRGRWLLENIFGTPPPPPPPDVPALNESNPPGRVLTMRERMAEHRRNPSCASCHTRMDPLGFALEGFDAIGRTRQTEADGHPIDTRASLPDGTSFDGLQGLKTLIVDQRQQFAQTVVEKLMTFAVGRGLEHYDMPAVRQIVRAAAAQELRWSSLITGIVESRPFQFRQVAQ
jgi:mono/diheme cytochrome c family protein